jgi:hypothetical protein
MKPCHRFGCNSEAVISVKYRQSQGQYQSNEKLYFCEKCISSLRASKILDYNDQILEAI